jgi:protein disulfide-isomerase
MSKKKSLIVALTLICASSMLLHAADQSVVESKPLPSSQDGQAPSTTQAASGHIQWMTNYQDAVAKAKAENKSIVLFFTGSDWCGWCKKMENEILSTPDFAKAAGNQFVFVLLDFPMNKTLPPAIADQNSALKQKYGITGYPTIIILDCDEKFVAETGYRSGGGKAYADYLMGLTH